MVVKHCRHIVPRASLYWNPGNICNMASDSVPGSLYMESNWEVGRGIACVTLTKSNRLIFYKVCSGFINLIFK